MAFDQLSLRSPATPGYRNTRTVRRFFTREPGSVFKLDARSMAWLKDGFGEDDGRCDDECLCHATVVKR